MRSTYVKDVMSCARACGAELNCNTANYNSGENKCELFKEQSLPEAAVMTVRGYHLITKVRHSISRLFKLEYIAEPTDYERYLRTLKLNEETVIEL